ncbi:MAG TPA: helix-turn-helix domain-containing protein [Candidatus Nanoarchaeia archaeon]|nr:helix-turn-helix domain-containing protein [Candidatus Nanoarchaeia archaeon]
MNGEILTQIGLSKNEIKVYFALLELEQSSATPIVRKSSIPNSKVYPTLEKLIKKGLVSYVIKNNVKYFQPSSPKNLIDLLDKKEKEIIRQKQKINLLISEIEAKKDMSKDKQEAVIYEGLEGVNVAFESILSTLKPNEEYQVFTLGKELEREELKRFFRNFHKRRIFKRIKARLLVNKKIRKIFFAYHKYSGMKVRYADLSLPTGVFIYGNNVMTVVWENNPTAFVITSKNNADRYKEFFENIWRISRN